MAIAPDSVVLAAYKWLVCYLLKLSEEKYSTLLSQGQDQFSAKNDAQAFCLRELALTYIEVGSLFSLIY